MSVSLFGSSSRSVKIRKILSLVVYKLTGEEIGKMRDPQSHDHNNLPEFCIRNDTGKLDCADYYLQFVNEGDEYFYLFNTSFMSEQLGEEVSNVGFEALFRHENFAELIKYCHVITYDEYYRCIPRESLFVVEMEYIGSGEDLEVDCGIIGFLNKDMNFVKIKKDDESKVGERWPKPWKYNFDKHPKIFAANGELVCTIPTGTLDGPYNLDEINELGSEIVQKGNRW